jgi:hypothetical protein
MVGLGSPFRTIQGYRLRWAMAKKHNFAAYAMEFLAPAGKSVFIALVE